MILPNGVVSLWDMLKIEARSFVYSIEFMGRIGRICEDPPDPKAVAETELLANVVKSLDDIAPFLGGYHVPATMSAVATLRDRCAEKDVLEKDIGRWTSEVFDRFNAELGDQWLFIVERDLGKFMADEVAPFGETIRDKFPNLAEDIDEAAKCLALARYTASVFHLMRVMEASIHTLAKKMKVSVDLRVASWNEITTAISNALNAMPGKTATNKKKKQSFAEIVANLTAVRIAWRNEVMHPKKTYTKKETLLIFNHVEGFLEALAKNV